VSVALQVPRAWRGLRQRRLVLGPPASVSLVGPLSASSHSLYLRINLCAYSLYVA
jgi:hypothetical protein